MADGIQRPNNIIRDKAQKLAERIVNMYKYLQAEHHEYTISKQVLRSGTSIGANLAEAQFAVSKREFLLKVGISLKETNETIYWLAQLYKGRYLTPLQYISINNDATEVLKILIAISKTTKANLDNSSK